VAPRREWPLLKLTVELDVEALVEEAEQVGDPPDLWERIGVVPDQVLTTCPLESSTE